MNISRRLFLLGGIGLAQSIVQPPSFAFGKAKPQKTGIHSIARTDWPPAIVPDRAAFVDKGFSCFTDQFGRLAIVDLKKMISPHVVGELNLQVKRVIDFVAVRQRGYAITLQDSATGDAQYMLTTLSLAPASEPSVLSRVLLNHFSDVSCLTATPELICVAGTTTRGTNDVQVFAARGKSIEPSYISSFSVEAPIIQLDLQERRLIVLESTGTTQVDYVNLFYPQTPQIRKTLKLDGDYRVMARSKDLLMVAGQPSASKVPEVKTIVLEPAPHAMQAEPLEGFNSVLSATAQKDRFYLLGDRGGERQLIEFAIGKDLRLALVQTLNLPSGKTASGQIAALSVSGKMANIASGWLGVDVLSQEKFGWRHAFTYTIPRFPASGVAIWNDYVVLAGADLKLYDITKPEKPVLMRTIEPGSTVKSIASAGVFVLCLGKNALSLRKMDNLSGVIAQADIAGQDMSFDKKNQRAYVLLSQEKKTIVTPIKAYSNKLVPEKPFELPAGFRRIVAADGIIVLCGLKDLALYQAGQTLEIAGRQSLDGYAIRDVAITDLRILVTAVDKQSKGFLFVLSREGKELGRVGATALPQDGVAIAASGDQAVVVGKTPDGKDLASILDLSTPAIPRVVASFPSVEASSAVTIKDRFAIVVGRGLEILSLG